MKQTKMQKGSGHSSGVTHKVYTQIQHFMYTYIHPKITAIPQRMKKSACEIHRKRGLRQKKRGEIQSRVSRIRRILPQTINRIARQFEQDSCRF